MKIDLYNKDCLEVLKTMANESIDLVVTDCPYRIVSGGCTTMKREDECGGVLNKRHVFTQENAKTGKLFKNNDIKFSEWLPDVYRVLKKGSHCYIMINARNLKDLQTEAEKAGFTFQNIIIWNKGNAVPNKYYMNAYEMILMLRKGRARNINNMGTKNILDVKNNMGNRLHPTEKPVELMKILIENSSNKGDTVMDLFMGAGSTGVASIECERNFIGIEIDKDFFKIAKERIEKYYKEDDTND